MATPDRKELHLYRMDFRRYFVKVYDGVNPPVERQFRSRAHADEFCYRQHDAVTINITCDDKTNFEGHVYNIIQDVPLQFHRIVCDAAFAMIPHDADQDAYLKALETATKEFMADLEEFKGYEALNALIDDSPLGVTD